MGDTSRFPNRRIARDKEFKSPSDIPPVVLNSIRTISQSTADDKAIGGVSTPGIGGVTNVSVMSSNGPGIYIRIDSIVTFAIEIQVTPSATGATEFYIDLPIASDIGFQYDIHGHLTCDAKPAENGSVEGDATNNRASCKFVAATTDIHKYKVTFIYRII